MAKCYVQNNGELRIVLLGKTGSGKSASGNTILGQKCFQSKLSAISLTVDCAMGRSAVDGQQVTVIDTPGLFDTRFGMDKTAADISQCISFALPGPHVFLVVIRLGRYTEEEKQTVQKVEEIFGQAANRYSMVLFTGGDLLEGATVEDFLAESSELKELVDRCQGQYHVFNNKSDDRSQVTELLQKIRNTVQRNGGSHYTNEMFQAATRAIEEKKQRIQREEEERRRREKAEMEQRAWAAQQAELRRIQAQYEADRERERRQREEQMRRQRQMWEMERERQRQREIKERQREMQERQWQMQQRQRQMEEAERQFAYETQRLAEQRQRELEAERERWCAQQQQTYSSSSQNSGCTIL